MEVTSKPVDLLNKYDETLFTENSVGFGDGNINLLKTKKLILNEQIDRIINSTLRELSKPPETATHETKLCKREVDSKTLEILGKVPAPKATSLSIIQSTLNRKLKKKQQRATKELIEKIEAIKNKHEVIVNERRLLRKYFEMWRSKLRRKDERFREFFEKFEKSKRGNNMGNGKEMAKTRNNMCYKKEMVRGKNMCNEKDKTRNNTCNKKEITKTNNNNCNEREIAKNNSHGEKETDGKFIRGRKKENVIWDIKVKSKLTESNGEILQRSRNKSADEINENSREICSNQKVKRNKSAGDLNGNINKDQCLEEGGAIKKGDFLRNTNGFFENQDTNNLNSLNANKNGEFFKKTNEMFENQDTNNLHTIITNKNGDFLRMTKDFFENQNSNNLHTVINTSNNGDFLRKTNDFFENEDTNDLHAINTNKSGEFLRKTNEISENSVVENECNNQNEENITRRNSNTKQIHKDIIKEKPLNEPFENRYKAQQDIISKQKLKLLEQERLIEEMKHGKICEELDSSIKESRLEMEEILRKCSLKTKLKIGIATTQETEDVIEVKVNKAPKIVQKMEKRAQERAEKRELIKERKRLIDEERKRQAEELVEVKRRQDEEERKRNLEAIKERRKRELELERMRKESKERFLMNCAKADKFYKRVLLRRGLRGFKFVREVGEENFYKAEIFCEISLERKCFKAWKRAIGEIKEEKLRKAEEFYRRMMLRKCFCLFVENRNAAKKNYQVAIDYSNLQLQSKVFQWLLKYTCMERVRLYKLHIKADKHYNYRILVTYFYQWKSLKAVLVLEKAQEEKKKKWREKVLQILPDYQPPVLDL